MPLTLLNRTPAPVAPSLASHVATIASDLRSVVSDHLELAILEAHQAGVRLTKILGGAVVAAILIVSAWLALVAGGIVWAAGQGVSWVAALVIAAGANLVLAVIVGYWIRTLTTDQLFTATLRQLRRDGDITGISP